MAAPDTEFDVIVLGTGLKECILSGLMSIEGKKVLHMDRNDFYGAESASLNLTQLFARFKGTQPTAGLGSDRDYNIDLIPKFLMGDGNLVKLLIYTTTNRYLDFKVLDGSYVYRQGVLHKVPATTAEIVSSPLMGFFEKGRCRKMMEFIGAYDENDPKTHKGIDLDRSTVRDVYVKFGVSEDTQEFVGHACACYLDDNYLDYPARDLFDRVLLYVHSIGRFTKSPYLYPLYGLGELPQAFARLAAVCGGTYKLRSPVVEHHYDANGRWTGVTTKKEARGEEKEENERANAQIVIADPSYFPEKCERIGQVVRSICILSHPIDGTNNAESCTVIIPQGQLNRRSDLYLSCVSSAHHVAKEGKWIVIASTTVETKDPESELAPALALLKPIDEVFTYVSDLYRPINNPAVDGIYLTSSYDATSHFQSSDADVLALYEKIMNKKIDFSNPPKLGGQDVEGDGVDG